MNCFELNLESLGYKNKEIDEECIIEFGLALNNMVKLNKLDINLEW